VRSLPNLPDQEIPALLNQVEQGSKDEKIVAMERLSRASTIPEPHVQAIVDAVLKVFKSDPDTETRVKAAQILHYKLPTTKETASALFAALDEPNEELLSWIVLLLPTEAEYVTDLIAAMKRPEPLIRRGVVSSLCYKLSDEPAITQALIETLNDSDEIVRSNSVLSIGMFEQRIAAAEQELISTLKDSSQNVALSAARALRKISRDNVEANQLFDNHIQAELRSRDDKARLNALIDLRQSPFIDAVHIEALRRLIETEANTMALELLAKIGAPAAGEIPVLKNLLRTTKNNSVMETTANTLAALGAQDDEILNYLAERLLTIRASADPSTTRAAASALSHFGKSAVPYLIKGLNWDNFIVRNMAVDSLSRLKQDASEAIPDILQIIAEGGGQPHKRHSHDCENRSAAFDALAAIGPDDERVLTCLAAIAADNHDTRRGAAIAALTTIGSESAMAILQAPPPTPPSATADELALLQLLQSEPMADRLAALNALQMHLPNGSNIFEEIVLKTFKHDPDIDVRLKSAQLVANSLPRTEATANALLEAMSDENQTFREAVAGIMPREVVIQYFTSLARTQANMSIVATNALASFGKEAVPGLISALYGGNFAIVSGAIGKIGPDAAEAVPAILRKIHEGHAERELKFHSQDKYSCVILDTLVAIAPEDESVLDCLTTLSRETNHQQTAPSPMAHAALAALATLEKIKLDGAQAG